MIPVSAMTGAGLDTLKTRLRTLLLGETVETIEGEFSARLRHVQALQRTAAHVTDANAQFAYEHLELTAEELRLAYKALGEINGSMSPDELLDGFSQTSVLENKHYFLDIQTNQKNPIKPALMRAYA